MVQVGLSSKFAPRGRYSWQETAQRDLNVWLVQRYRRAWTARGHGGALKPKPAPSRSPELATTTAN